MSKPRDVRNNNPGNIDFNPRNDWQGQIGKEPDGRFAIFDTPESGIRALGKLLINYRGKDGMYAGVRRIGCLKPLESFSVSPRHSPFQVKRIRSESPRISIPGGRPTGFRAIPHISICCT
ncbi:hypothetical protein [Pseudomonas putida]|uniref:hypothetical protein n=1 Tax=Pseudomonas putida TaxID=303 RepID=UPI00390614EC